LPRPATTEQPPSPRGSDEPAAPVAPPAGTQLAWPLHSSPNRTRPGGPQSGSAGAGKGARGAVVEAEHEGSLPACFLRTSCARLQAMTCREDQVVVDEHPRAERQDRLFRKALIGTQLLIFLLGPRFELNQPLVIRYQTRRVNQSDRRVRGNCAKCGIIDFVDVTSAISAVDHRIFGLLRRLRCSIRAGRRRQREQKRNPGRIIPSGFSRHRSFGNPRATAMRALERGGPQCVLFSLGFGFGHHVSRSASTCCSETDAKCVVGDDSLTPTNVEHARADDSGCERTMLRAIRIAGPGMTCGVVS
jgi:hypothetical protein